MNDDFNEKLEQAIMKRYPEKNKPVVSLSSGLDSGIICCVLNDSFPASSVGNASASSLQLVWRDCVPPRIADRA